VTRTNDRSADRFNHEDPSTSGVLVRTLRSNDVRNESEHAYVQSLHREVEELNDECAELQAEENGLKAREAAHASAAAAAAQRAEKEEVRVAEQAVRFEQLHARLMKMRPALTESVGRLYEHYASLADTEIPELTPLPVSPLPVGLQPLPMDEKPLDTGMEDELEQLDAMMQRIVGRVRHIVLARAGSADKDAYGEEEPVAIDESLKGFIELPPEVDISFLKAARADLEAIVARHKDTDDGH